MSTELYFYFLLLPLIGAAIPLLWLRSSYDEAMRDPALRMKLEEPMAVVAGPYSGKKVKDGLQAWLKIFKGLSAGIFVYGLVGFILFKGRLDSYTGPVEAADAVGSSAGMAIGLACLGAGIGIGIVVRDAVKGLITQIENATWYLIFAALAEGIALYGLVIMFLILGKLGRVTAADAASLSGPATTFGALSLLSGVLVGYLPSRVSVSANGYGGWTTKLVAAAIGLSVALIGLVYAFVAIGSAGGHYVSIVDSGNFNLCAKEDQKQLEMTIMEYTVYDEPLPGLEDAAYTIIFNYTVYNGALETQSSPRIMAFSNSNGEYLYPWREEQIERYAKSFTEAKLVPIVDEDVSGKEAKNHLTIFSGTGDFRGDSMGFIAYYKNSGGPPILDFEKINCKYNPIQGR